MSLSQNIDSNKTICIALNDKPNIDLNEDLKERLILISTVKAGETICVGDRSIVRKGTWFTAFKRYYTSENKEKTCKFVTDTLEDFEKYISYGSSSTKKEELLKMRYELESGINALIDTYISSPEIVTLLSVSIMKINECIEGYLSSSSLDDNVIIDILVEDRSESEMSSRRNTATNSMDLTDDKTDKSKDNSISNCIDNIKAGLANLCDDQNYPISGPEVINDDQHYASDIETGDAQENIVQIDKENEPNTVQLKKIYPHIWQLVMREITEFFNCQNWRIFQEKNS
jgi:hypothetical protein